MTGNEIKGLRAALGLGQLKLGQILGIVESGIAKWEARGSEEVNTDELRDQLTHMLATITSNRMSSKDRIALGAKLHRTVARRGSMYGVYLILREFYDRDPVEVHEYDPS